MKQIILLASLMCILFSCDKEIVIPTDNLPESEEEITLELPVYHTFNGKLGSTDNSTILTNDNNVLICGDLNSEIIIIKSDLNGDLLWRKEFPLGKINRGSAIVETSNRDLFICGHTTSKSDMNKNDFLLIKANSSGDMIWSKTYGGIENDYARNLIITSDGNLLIAGKTNSFGVGSSGDIYLVKVNTDGDTLWTKSYENEDQEASFDLMETSDGNYLITGTNQHNGSNRGLYLLKVSSLGEKLWDKTFWGGEEWKWGFSTIELSDGTLMTCGRSTKNGINQVLVMKLDREGDRIWEKLYSGRGISEEGGSIIENMNGNLTIAGRSNKVSSQSNIIVFQINKEGILQWYKGYETDYSDSGSNVIQDLDGNLIVTGNAVKFLGGPTNIERKIFMTKLDSDGNYK